MFSDTFTLTKRHLGILLVVGSILAIIGLLAIDMLDVGREGGIGPAQRIALGMMVLTTLVGLSLIPLGNKPA